MHMQMTMVKGEEHFFDNGSCMKWNGGDMRFKILKRNNDFNCEGSTIFLIYNQAVLIYNNEVGSR